MRRFFDRLDALAEIRSGPAAIRWLERAAFVFLFLMVLAAPHSIAATQTAWIAGTFFLLLRLAFKPRPKLRLGPLDIALWSLFLWSVITSAASYAPDISFDKLRGAAVFLIFYFTAYFIRNLRTASLLAFALIGSCMVNVLWVPVERLIGRGVEIHGLAPGGPLAKALLWEGDALIEAGGQKVDSPEDVLAAVEQSEATPVKFYRPDFEFTVEVKRADLLPGNSAVEKLGFTRWEKSHNWRSSGFYGHYTTYAEVLQLIGSLVLGLLVGIAARRFRFSSLPEGRVFGLYDRRFIALLICFTAICLALLLTVTRAPQLGLIISAGVIVLAGLGRKWYFRALLIIVPLAVIGVVFLQKSREVGFFDPNDDSIRWRLTVWQEGFDLWTDNARNFTLGVGMDSIKRYAGEWRLFDDGKLNMGHFHSTPLQLLTERGLPALLLWLAVLWIYIRSLWRGLHSSEAGTNGRIGRGILLGCLGGTAGFFASGIVHYNLGDQEVAMVFFILMALGMRSAALRETADL